MNLERIDTLKKFLEMDPADIFSRFALGMEYADGFPEQALEHFQEVVKRDGAYVPGYFQAGKVCAAAGNTEKAREWLEKGLATAEQVGDWHAHGEIQEALDDLD